MTGRSQPLEATSGSPTAAGAPPRWLVPLVVGLPLIAALLVFGIVSPAALLYAGLFGGMMLLCMRGHGEHSEHVGHPAGGDGSANERADRVRP